MQISHRGAAAQTLAGGQLVVTDALLVTAVEILYMGHAEFFGRADKAFGEGMARLDAGCRQGPVCAACGTRAKVVALGTTEVRQYIVPAPTHIAGAGPGIVVGALATNENEPVD
ncbi:hypothetical protein D3C80_1674010 [compost metagenome]